MHHRGACRLLVHRTHTTVTTRARRVHKVVCVAPLDELCSMSDRPTLHFHYYDIMHHIVLPDKQEFR